MTITRKMLKVKGARDVRLTQSRITLRLRGKKTRNLTRVDPEAKKRTGKASTRQRRVKNLKVAAKVEKKAEDLKAETSLTSIKVRIEEDVQGARTEVKKRKKSQKLITAKMERKVMTLIKSRKKTTQEETGRKAGQGPKTGKESLKRIDLHYQRRPRKNENRAEREAENVVGETVRGRIREEEVPGMRNIKRVLTETRPEIHREAGGLGVGAIDGTTAKITRLIEGTEKPHTKDEGEAEASTATRTREEGATEAQTPGGAEGTAPPETGGVPQDPTVQKAKKARGRDLALARTVTDILKLKMQKLFFYCLSTYTS